MNTTMTLEQLPPKGVKREQAILALGKEEANGELFLQLVNTEKGKCKTAAQKALAQLEYAPAAPLWAKLVKGKWMGSHIMSDACSDCVSEQIAPVILKTLSLLLDEADTKPLEEGQVEQMNFCFHLMLGKASPKMLEVYRFLAENAERIGHLKHTPFYDGDKCAYRENGPDQNAWIVSRDGAVLSRFCLGDGIQDCVVKKDGTIITSYFDEGVFGNYGWDEPLGACGLIAWTSEGTPLWKNENYSIYDCYAISLDEEENLWFYYYDEFRLVRTNFKEDFVFELPIEGSGAFSVAPSGNTFLFQGGYQQRDKFYFLTAHGDHLGKKQEAIPTCDGNKVAVEQCSLLRSRMLFLGKDGVLYGGIWGSDGQ